MKEPVFVPITDEMDLHSFPPGDVPAVVEEYIREARARGFPRVRIVHGRGRGVQRAVVRRLLASLEGVRGFVDAPPDEGGWGATLVDLEPAFPTPSKK